MSQCCECNRLESPDSPCPICGKAVCSFHRDNHECKGDND